MWKYHIFFLSKRKPTSYPGSYLCSPPRPPNSRRKDCCLGWSRVTEDLDDYKILFGRGGYSTYSFSSLSEVRNGQVHIKIARSKAKLKSERTIENNRWRRKKDERKSASSYRYRPLHLNQNQNPNPNKGFGE